MILVLDGRANMLQNKNIIRLRQMIKTHVGHDSILLYDTFKRSHWQISTLIDLAQESDVIRTSPCKRRVVNLMRGKKAEWTAPIRNHADMTLRRTPPGADVQSTFPPSNLAAVHLAEFMGKELTSGRLPCYPSSVWKLIPSSVSNPETLSLRG